MHTEQVTLVKREDLNEAIKLQYDLDDNYDCWIALFSSEAIAPFEFYANLSEDLKKVKKVSEIFYSNEIQNTLTTLQYLVDCGYDRILIEY